jgi:hypothetical protein
MLLENGSESSLQWEPKKLWASFPKPARRHRQALVRLIIAAVLAFDGVGAERHQPLETGSFGRELDHHPTGRIPANQIAGFKDRMEESIYQGHRPHRWLPMSRCNLGAEIVNEALRGNSRLAMATRVGQSRL